MKKIRVEICIGTTCFVLGASELQNLEEELPSEIARDVDIRGTSCLGICKDHHYQRVPCVMIDGTPYENPSLSDLIDEITQLVGARRKEDANDEK